MVQKWLKEMSRKCYNHKSQPIPDTKRKTKKTQTITRKANKRTKSTHASSLFPKRGDRNVKRTENIQEQNARQDIRCCMLIINGSKVIFYRVLIFFFCCKPYIVHYENTPIQIYRKFYLQTLKIFRYKSLLFFIFLLKNIDCGYSLEPPRRGGSNEYHNICF